MGNNRKNSVDGKVTRRAALQFMVVGGLTVITGLQIAYRCLKPKNKLGVTEITIEGPFEADQIVRPQDLGQKYREIKSADFELLRVTFVEGKRKNEVILCFTVSGKEDPSHKMKVMASVYGNNDQILGQTELVYEDPRIVARKANALDSLYVTDPVATISIRLDPSEDENIAQISRIEIFAMNVENP